eukprot:10859051-Alexandrium_andersonii.AAC.1
MSASLVGSEMCIRDSCTLGGARQSHRAGLSRRCPRSPWIAAWSRPAPIAVSYTHLTLPTICSV